MNSLLQMFYWNEYCISFVKNLVCSFFFSFCFVNSRYIFVLVYLSRVALQSCASFMFEVVVEQDWNR